MRDPQNHLRDVLAPKTQLRYAEIRALVGGVTAIQGTGGLASAFQDEALVRNVDKWIFGSQVGRALISAWWSDAQRSWDEAVAKIRADIDSRKAEHDLHKAQHRADRAEEEARFAIDFAYSAVVEAEYAVLDAALTRVEADDLSK